MGTTSEACFEIGLLIYFNASVRHGEGVHKIATLLGAHTQCTGWPQNEGGPFEPLMIS